MVTKLDLFPKRYIAICEIISLRVNEGGIHMIDSHIHLDQYDGGEIKDRIKSWQENGIDGVVAVATNLRSSYEILKLKQDFPTFIRAAIGHHPEIPPPSKHDLDELIKLIKSERHNLSGIGEIGLPTYRKEELLERNGEEEFNAVLETFLQLAKDEQFTCSTTCYP